MARTDVRKVKEAIRVPCPIDGFNDEFHWIKPATRELSAKVDAKSKVKEFRRGQLVEETDNKLFVEHYLDEIWVNWENVGIIHDDGRVEDPATCTTANKIILANSRPIDFILWLQNTSQDLAAQVQQQAERQRDRFQETDPASTGSSAAGL
jgi:hypothetical protein